VFFAIGSWIVCGDAAGQIKPPDDASRAPDVFDGKNWPLGFAARPERDYAWSWAKQDVASDDERPSG
jgi:hypothetical protein